MLSSKFFQSDTSQVAKDLVGTFLVTEDNQEKNRCQITETEAYLGSEDTASHARFGKTARSQVMYGPAGVMYVYIIYGIHHMLNIVTEEDGQAGAVLIRGIEVCDGPAKLTKHLRITKQSHNKKPLGKESGVWIESRPDSFNIDNIKSTARVGIGYATEEWREKPLRFVLSP